MDQRKAIGQFLGDDMNKFISSHLDELPIETKVGFFIGQAIILVSYPIEILAAFRELPSFAEAQANEGLILALCAYIPFTIICEIVAWLGFVKKQKNRMIVGTIAPLLVLVALVYLAIYTA